MGRYEKWNEAIAKDYLHQEEPLFDMKRKEGERWTPENRFMYEDIVRFFGGVVIRYQYSERKPFRSGKRLRRCKCGRRDKEDSPISQ